MHGSLLPCTIVQLVSYLQQIDDFCVLEYILLLLDCFKSFKCGLKSCVVLLLVCLVSLSSAFPLAHVLVIFKATICAQVYLEKGY